MLFLLWFKVKQPESLSQKRLMEIWEKEAEAAMSAVKSGKIRGLWKLGGKREVIAILDANSHEELDEIVETLPITKELGYAIDIDVYPLYSYDNFYELMKKLTK